MTITPRKKSLSACKLVILIESMKRQLFKGKVDFSWVRLLTCLTESSWNASEVASAYDLKELAIACNTSIVIICPMYKLAQLLYDTSQP